MSRTAARLSCSSRSSSGNPCPVKRDSVGSFCVTKSFSRSEALARLSLMRRILARLALMSAAESFGHVVKIGRGGVHLVRGVPQIRHELLDLAQQRRRALGRERACSRALALKFLTFSSLNTWSMWSTRSMAWFASAGRLRSSTSRSDGAERITG